MILGKESPIDEAFDYIDDIQDMVKNVNTEDELDEICYNIQELRIRLDEAREKHEE